MIKLVGYFAEINGEIGTVNVTESYFDCQEITEKIGRWCAENLKSLYVVGNGFVRVEELREAAMLKMMFADDLKQV